jgi:large subunit ribosomal protein L17
MFRNQLTALFTHERITTTLAKAKELRPLAERMVTLAGTGTLPARRKVLTMVPDKEVVRRLFDDIAPRFSDRPGGYTRIMRVGRRRGDGAEMAVIEFVDFDLEAHEEGKAAGGGKASLMDRAKGIFGGRGGDEADDAVDAEAVDEAAEPIEAGPADDEVEEQAEAAAADEPETAEPAAEPAAEEPEKKSAAADDEPAEPAEAAEPEQEPEAEAEPADEAATEDDDEKK